MATLSSGITGPVRGRTGPVVSYTRYGQNIIRHVGDTRKNKLETPARKIQREKIKVCNLFTGAFTGSGFFNRTFPAFGHTGSGYNRVTGALMNLAIITVPDTALNWPKVLISKGKVASVETANAAVDEERNIVFEWVNNAGTGTAKDDDKAVLVAYFPESGEAVFEISQATRKSEQAVIRANFV